MQDACSTSSAKLLLKKWMILTVLLSNSWLVNNKQLKKNIGKDLCISWAGEICFITKEAAGLALEHLLSALTSNNIPQTKRANFSSRDSENPICLV